MSAVGLRTTLPRLLAHRAGPFLLPRPSLPLQRFFNSSAAATPTPSALLFGLGGGARAAPKGQKEKEGWNLLAKRAFGTSGGGKRQTFQGRPASQTPALREPEVDWTRVATSAGLATLGALGLHFALNRETRDALSAAESSYLNDTFKWSGAGLAITALTAKLLHSNGFAARMMMANPWLVMGVGLVGGIGSMMAVYNTSPDSGAHFMAWAAFSAIQGVTLSPMFFLNPAILSRAGLYTVGALGGLCYVGSTAKSETYLYWGGPLLAGLGVLVVASLAPMVMPRMAVRTMSILENVTAYGGVALFSGMILYDTQKILKHAQLAEQGLIPRDPIRESVSLILDAINLFVRIVQVLMLQQGGGSRRK